MEYKLSCECGRTSTIVSQDAGATKLCECGKQIQVPSLRALRSNLTDVASQQQAPKQDWDLQLSLDFHFEGNELVVYTDTTLPMYCVKTGEPVTAQDMQQRRITCYQKPVWPRILSLIGLDVPKSVFAKSCLVTYGLSPRIRKRYLRRQWASVAAMILAVIILRTFLFLPFDFVFAIFYVTFCISSLILIFGSGFKLLDAQYKDGNFRVLGCSPLFRKALEESQHLKKGSGLF